MSQWVTFEHLLAAPTLKVGSKTFKSIHRSCPTASLKFILASHTWFIHSPYSGQLKVKRINGISIK